MTHTECGKPNIANGRTWYCVLRPLHPGACSPISGNADHENTLPFGPCAGPSIMGERAFFCQGAGFASLDPAKPFDLDEIIVCVPCRSLRESQPIEQNVLTITESLERVA